LVDDNAAAISFDASGQAGILAIDTQNGAEQVLFGKNLQVTDGIGTFISTSNTVSNILVTNNTVTTFGADADSSGVVVIRSTSLTTGALLQLQTTEGTLAGGFYIVGRDVTGGANVYTVGEDGATVISGTGGSNMLTVTAGDAVLSDGSLAITDADNALSFSVTNNTVAAAPIAKFVGSGTFTGSGDNAFLWVDPSGLTTGTAMSITPDAMTTGKGLHISVDAATTGNAIEVTSTSTALTSGQFVDVNHTVSGTTIGDMTGARINYELSHTYTQTSGTVAHDYDDLSIKRTMVTTGAGGTMTSAGALLKIETVSTQTAGTLTDTVNGIEVVMDAQSTGDGVNITHNAVTSKALNMTSSATTEDGVVQLTANSVNSGNAMVIDANGLTTGTALELSSTGTIVTTGEVLNVIANSATTATALIRASGTALTDGWVMELTGGGANATASGGVLNIQAGASTNGNALQVVSTGAIVAASVGMIEFTANSLTTGDLLDISGTAQTTGNLILATGGGATLASGGAIARFDMGAATAGSGLEIVTSGDYVDATDGVLNITANSATTGNIAIINATAATTGTLLELNATGGTLTTGNYLVCNDAGLDVFAVRRNGHLFGSQTTKPTIAVTTQNGITAAAVTNGSTDTCGEITTTGTSAAGDTVLTVTFEEAYANAPRVFIQPTNEAAAQNADDATSGAYISATTTTTFVITIPGASGSTPSFDYFVFETTVA
jgi:hypothetical protein